MKTKKIFLLVFTFFFSLLLLNAQMVNKQRPPAGTRFNDGYNPFFAPMDTTTYYGSGDVNLDGVVNATDLTLLGEIASGTRSPNPRADVNGDGLFDFGDCNFLYSYLYDGVRLPGMWNQLLTREARISWVNKIRNIDNTNLLSWSHGWFVCGQYSRQFAENCRGSRIDHFDEYELLYNGGSALYNIPMYTVSLVGGSHAITAILVGDNPTNFADWYFIEPQDDTTIVTPGIDYMLPGNVVIEVNDYAYTYPLVTFNLAQNDGAWSVTCTQSDSSLVTTRPATLPPSNPDNRRDFWNPRILNTGSGKVIFNAPLETMARNGDSDVFQSDLPFSADATRSVITQSSVMGQLLDVYQDQAGVNHILYLDKPKLLADGSTDNIYGLYYGTYDVNQGKILNAEPVLGYVYLKAKTAKLCVEADGTVHVFWYQSFFGNGLYWTYKNSSGWHPRKLLVDAGVNIMDYAQGNWVTRSLDRNLFSVVYTGGKVYLAWVNQEHQSIWNGSTFVESWPRDANYMICNNKVWGTANYITSWGDVNGLDLKADAQGTLHLVFTRGAIATSNPALPAFEEGRGSLYYTYSVGSNWNYPACIDYMTTNLFPKLELQPVTGDMYLVWEKKVNDQVVTAWSKYAGNQWSTIQTLPIRQGADAWYPDVKALNNGDIMVAFSSRCPNWATVETYKIGELSPSIDISYEVHETAATANIIRPWFKIKNTGGTNLNLADITIRYWFTLEGTSLQSGACDYASIGGTNITAYVHMNFTPVVPGGTDYYETISFDSGAGSLAPGQETDAIQTRFWKTDWTNYTQTGDYSFDASMTSFTENTKITGYVSGSLLFGILPQ